MWPFKRKRIGKKNAAASRNRKRNLLLEQLQKRELFAADVSAFLSQGLLYVYGSNQSDNIEIRFDGDRISIPGVSIKNNAGNLVSSVSRSEVPSYVIAAGQAGNDRIAMVEMNGTKALPVVMLGGAGNDTLIGGSNNDSIVGMDGVDTIFGMGGNDYLVAGLNASDELDLPQSNILPERLYGGEGDDELIGSRGKDELYGEGGNDSLRGLDGDDLMSGGTGINRFIGGGGIDTLLERNLTRATLTNNRLGYAYAIGNNGGFATEVSIDGIERAQLFAKVDAASGVRLDASQFSGNVRLEGSSKNDILLGGAGNDVLTGGDGVDEIDGGLGYDQLVERNIGSQAMITTSSFANGVTNLIKGSPRLEKLKSIESADLSSLAWTSQINAKGFSGPVTLRGPSGSNRVYSIGGTFDQREFFVRSKEIDDKLQQSANLRDFYGRSVKEILGMQIRNEVPTVNGGRMAQFTGGAIFYSASTGAHVVIGAMHDLYQSLGAATGRLGLPISDELNLIDPKNYSAKAGRMILFQNGSLIWTPAAGARETAGTATIADYTLRVIGTERSDTLTVLNENGFVAIPNVPIKVTSTLPFGGAQVDEYYLSFSNTYIEATKVQGLGGNDTISLIEGPFAKAITLFAEGGSGDDTIRGGSFNDQLFGAESGKYTYYDGINNLFGNAGNDHLNGGNSTDFMYGGKGLDMLFGSGGFNFYNGNEDGDRFLLWDGVDYVLDNEARDATVRFTNTTSNLTTTIADKSTMFSPKSWTESEIRNVDVALGELVDVANNTRLLKSADGANFTYQRVGTNLTGNGYFAWNNGSGLLGFSSDAIAANDVLHSTIYHELGHNWHVESLNGHSNTYFQQFLAISGWIDKTQYNKLSASDKTKYTQNSLGDANWYYLRSQVSTDFARPYGTWNPYDDFATTWESVFYVRSNWKAPVIEGSVGNNYVYAKAILVMNLVEEISRTPG